MKGTGISNIPNLRIENINLSKLIHVKYVRELTFYMCFLGQIYNVILYENELVMSLHFHCSYLKLNCATNFKSLPKSYAWLALLSVPYLSPEYDSYDVIM